MPGYPVPYSLQPVPARWWKRLTTKQPTDLIVPAGSFRLDSSVAQRATPKTMTHECITFVAVCCRRNAAVTACRDKGGGGGAARVKVA